MEQQSAVEFAVEKLEKLIPSGNQIAIYAILEQAKAMHKEEIMNAHNQGYADGYRDNGISPINYYNEIFKTK